MTNERAIEIIKQTPIYRYEQDKEAHSELFEALDMAVGALEKQIPRKPIKKAAFCRAYTLCPVCGTDVKLKIDGGWAVYYEPHCRCCGQRIDWSEEE